MAYKHSKKRSYMINLQHWRSAAALFACNICMIACYYAVGESIIYYIANDIYLGEYFRYYTTISNLLTMIASGFVIPYAITGFRTKRFVMPRWLCIMLYSGVVCITLTLVFVLCFISWYDPVFAFTGSNFYLHIICPIMVLICFYHVEAPYRYTKRDSLIAMIPFVIYSFFYFYNVLISKRWPDLYMLNTFVPFWFSFPALYLVTYCLAAVLRKASNYLKDLRQYLLLKDWGDNIDPIELNIEVYGLGRYYGTIGDEYDLSIPYDLLEALAKKYSLKAEDLTKIYVKGMMDAVNKK